GHRQHEARAAEDPEPLHHAGEQSKLRRVEGGDDRSRLLVADHVDEGAVAVEDRRRRRRAHRRLSHLVGVRCRSGWLTSRCQTTAAIPSVWGVIRSAATVGMITHPSASCRVVPPSRPTMPKTRAPTSRACSRARTRLTLTLRSRLPPPTEKTSTPSPWRTREPRSHSTKEESQPSSLIRAVSSLTLSVGAYASKPQSLRKSLTAWLAWPALP